ncbi:unnamed protein product, partial [Oppiella nova]
PKLQVISRQTPAIQVNDKSIIDIKANSSLRLKYPNNLIVPIEGSDEFIIVPVLENSTSLEIPCKPTNSASVVTLHSYDSKIENFVQMSNDLLAYDPTLGFTVHNFPFKQYNALDCKVKSGLKEQYIGVTVHQISKFY